MFANRSSAFWPSPLNEQREFSVAQFHSPADRTIPAVASGWPPRTAATGCIPAAVAGGGHSKTPPRASLFVSETRRTDRQQRAGFRTTCGTPFRAAGEFGKWIGNRVSSGRVTLNELNGPAQRKPVLPALFSKLLLDSPVHGEQCGQRGLLLQLAFDFGDELFAAAVNVVLGIEERPTTGVALAFQCFDLLLTG